MAYTVLRPTPPVFQGCATDRRKPENELLAFEKLVVVLECLPRLAGLSQRRAGP